MPPGNYLHEISKNNFHLPAIESDPTAKLPKNLSEQKFTNTFVALKSGVSCNAVFIMLSAN